MIKRDLFWDLFWDLSLSLFIPKVLKVFKTLCNIYKSVVDIWENFKFTATFLLKLYVNYLNRFNENLDCGKFYRFYSIGGSFPIRLENSKRKE